MFEALSSAQELAARLAGPEAGQRILALRQLLKSPDPRALPAVLERIPFEQDPRTLSLLLVAVGRCGSPEHLQVLLGFFDHESDLVRAYVIEALLHLSTSASLAMIVLFLADASREVKAHAVSALNRLGSKRFRKLVETMVGAPQPWMRQAAVGALVLLDARRARALLVPLLDDPDAKVSKRARAVEKKLDESEIVEGTTKPDSSGLEPRADGAPDSISGGFTAVSPRPSITDVSVDSLNLEDVEGVIRARDLEALARLIEDPSSREDRFVRSRLMSAIGILDDRRSAQVLADHLQDRDPRVVSNAIRSLTRLEDRRASQEITGLLASSNTRIRTSAIAHVSRLGRGDVTEALTELLRAPDITTKLAGLVCLSEIDSGELLSSIGCVLPPDRVAQVRRELSLRLEGLGVRRLPSGAAVLAALSTALPIRQVEALPSDPAFITDPKMLREVLPEWGARVSPSGRLTGDEEPPGSQSRSEPGHRCTEEIQVSARKFSSIVLAGRVTAAFTDVVIMITVFISLHLVLDALAGGVPSSLTLIWIILGVAWLLARDLPGGPGIGKKLLGLKLKSSQGDDRISIWALVTRQRPLILAPWGIYELWVAGSDPGGQRSSDRKAGIEVQAVDQPQLGALALVWLIAGCTLLGSVSLHRAVTVPRPDRALASDSNSSGTVGGPGTSISIEGRSIQAEDLLDHPLMGVVFPLPSGWRLEARSESWLELAGSGSGKGWRGWILVEIPGPESDVTSPAAWAEVMARRTLTKFKQDGTTMVSWSMRSKEARVGDLLGPIYEGRTLDGQDVLVFSARLSDRVLGIALWGVRPDGTAGSRDLLISLSRGARVRPIASTRPAAIPGAFSAAKIALPGGWRLDREDRSGIILRPMRNPDSGYMRIVQLTALPDLAAALEQGKLTEWVTDSRKPNWEVVGYRPGIYRVVEGAPGVDQGLTVELRQTDGTPAQWKGVLVHSQPRQWIEEWLARDVSAYEGVSLAVAQTMALASSTVPAPTSPPMDPTPASAPPTIPSPIPSPAVVSTRSDPPDSSSEYGVRSSESGR